MASLPGEPQRSTHSVPPVNGGAQQLIRLLVLAPIAVLGVVITVAAFQAPVEDSISAYHGGQFRDMFVGGLTATAIALVAFWGTTFFEDYALNVAGFYAVFVAIVPWNIEQQLMTPDPLPGLDARFVVKIMLGSYLAVTLVLGLVDLFRGRWSIKWILFAQRNDATLREEAATEGKIAPRSWSVTVGLLSIVALLVYVAFVLYDVFWLPETMFVGLHFGAAILLFIHLGLAVVGQAWNWMPQMAKPITRLRRHAYKVIVLLMLVAVAIALILGGRDVPPLRLVLWLEVAEVALFLVFWCMELGRFWNLNSDPA